MTPTEIAALIGTTLGGGTIGALGTAWARRGSSREESATAVVGPLLKRVDSLEKRLDKCEEKHAESERRQITIQREASQAHEQIAVLREHISARDGAIADLRRQLSERERDVTQRVRAEVRRSLTPTGRLRLGEPDDTHPETPRARSLGRMTREIPAPRGAKEDR